MKRQSTRIAKRKYDDVDELIFNALENGPLSLYKISLRLQDKIEPELAMQFYRTWIKGIRSDPESLYPTLEHKLEKGVIAFLSYRLGVLSGEKRVRFIPEEQLWTVNLKIVKIA